MLRSGIIEKFIVRVNPSGFGYRTGYVTPKNMGAPSREWEGGDKGLPLLIQLKTNIGLLPTRRFRNA